MNNKDNKSSAFKIRSIQAASLYRKNNNYKFVYKKKVKLENGSISIVKEYKDATFDYNRVSINNSIFAEYLRKHGVTINRLNESLDLVMMKFDYGVDADDSIKGIERPSVTIQELRDYYYENGAVITWSTFDSQTGKEIIGKRKTIKYKRLLRSPGKAKEGYCLFIREELHKKTLDYITMGLGERMTNKLGAKIVELSAYAPLITATAIDYINIPLENIFVLEDEKVTVMKKAISVKSDLKTKECFCDRNTEKSEISNILWDGMGLIDESIFPENMEGFIYCRSHFFKSCLFKGKIQNYFKDYYDDGYDIKYVTDMFGRSIKVTDIKVIITENSLKWIKFKDLMSKKGTLTEAFKFYNRVMKKDNERFAIVKTAHKSNYGDLQRSSFQMNNTLLTVDRKILEEIATPSIKYINNLKMNDEAFLEYLRITGTAKYSINNVLIDLYKWNEQFKYSEYFKKKKTAKINELKDRRVKLGKLFQNGDNLTICGNPVAMLMKVVGENPIKEGCFKQLEDKIQCSTTRFAEGETLAGFRSPHNAPNNIIYMENTYPKAILRYFPNLGDNVIVINGIGTDVQSRLNGQDLDSDSIFVTDQRDIVELARKAYLTCPTIVNRIGSNINNKYDTSMKSYSKMDSDIAALQYNIGLASNIAQLALSYWFDGDCKNQELEDIFVICSVLAQVAIDSAKRSFDVNIGKELNRLRNKTYMKNQNPKYPVFYASVQKCKNRKKKHGKFNIKKDNIRFFNCPMDILYGLIEEGVIDYRKHKELNTRIDKESKVGVKQYFEYNAKKINVNRKQFKKVINIISEYENYIEKLNEYGASYNEECMNEFERCMDRLKNFVIKNDTMYSLINYAFTPGKERIRDSLLVALYDKNDDIKEFLKFFKKTEKSSQKSL